MKSLLFLLALSCQAQNWEYVQAIEGSKVFRLLHGQYIALDLTPSQSVSGPTVSFSPQGRRHPDRSRRQAY
jgi:hypothetical protein